MHGHLLTLLLPTGVRSGIWPVQVLTTPSVGFHPSPMNDVPLSFNATSSSSWTVSQACMHDCGYLSEKRLLF